MLVLNYWVLILSKVTKVPVRNSGTDLAHLTNGSYVLEENVKLLSTAATTISQWKPETSAILITQKNIEVGKEDSLQPRKKKLVFTVKICKTEKNEEQPKL